MDNIALICGDGNLPYLIGNSLKNKKFNITFFILNSVKDKQKYKNEKHIHVNKLSVKTIISLLKKSNIQKIILAGSIKRPSIYDVSFDLDTIKLAKKLILENKGDDNLLTTLKKYFEDNGFHFFNWTKHCKELFSNENNLTLSKPSKLALQNLDKAKTIYKYYKKTDIGQSIIVQNHLVLGIEAIEGTDELIERCYSYKRKGDKGILFKFNKHNQSKLIDIPTIGLDTIKNLKKFNYEGIFLEKNKCIIVDKDIVKEFANSNNIFISSVVLN